MENNNGQMPESELQAGELKKEDTAGAAQLVYDPSKPSVIFIEVIGDQLYIDWNNFHDMLGVMSALQNGLAGAAQKIQTQINTRPVPPRPPWAGKRN